jgi:uncharacterized protein (TIGR03083 family)
MTVEPEEFTKLGAGPWLTHLKRETEQFAAVVRRSPPQVHVPAYPDFTVHSLAAHIGRGLRLFRAVVAGGRDAPSTAVPEGEDVADWVLAGLNPLVTLLGEVPPDKPVPFPHNAGDRPAGLIAPLLAVEVGVHRWDAESVLGEHAPIPADLAIQEVESVFTNFVPRLASSGVADIGGTVWLRAADTAAAWSIQVKDGGLTTQRAPDGTERAPGGPSGPSVVVTGAAQDIALLVWKRALPPRTELEVGGNVDVLKRFLVTDYIPDPRTTPAH